MDPVPGISVSQDPVPGDLYLRTMFLEPSTLEACTWFPVPDDNVLGDLVLDILLDIY